MNKKKAFIIRFLKFTIMFAILYTVLVIFVPYFQRTDVLSLRIIQISVVSILYGLIMAIVQPKVEINKYKKKNPEEEEETK